MSDRGTLNSRLRVLIARTYRAEKLYASNAISSAAPAVSSPKHSRFAKRTTTARNNIFGNQGRALSDREFEQSLGDIANRTRAKEWERSHYNLRQALNKVLSLGSSKQQSAEITELREEFRLSARESMDAVDKGLRMLEESTKRQEFSHIFKISLELVREKARIQANSIIAEELSYLLGQAGKSSDAERFAPAASSAAQEEELVAEADEVADNVISLDSRRAAAGRG